MTETSVSTKSIQVPATRGNAKGLPTGSILLTVGGLLLLGWLAWVMYFPDPLPYHYQLMQQGGVERFPELSLPANTDIVVSKYQLRIDEKGKPLATVYVGADDKNDMGPVLLDWQNRIGEPLITMTPPIGEFSNLLTAMNEHLSDDAVVIGWWDTTRRLKLFADIETPFNRHLSVPLIVPDIWRDQRQIIAQAESHFWGVGDRIAQSRFQFDGFKDALLADKAVGVEKLKSFARGRELYLVLHISDAYRLGMADPERFGIGFRDFPSSSNIHAASQHVKKWLKQEGYRSFTLEKRDPSTTRIYFLTDESYTDSFIAQALPFTSSRPFDLPGLSVVYQSGGFWIFKLAK